MNKDQSKGEDKVERTEPSRWNALLGRGLFETIIVAVGVFLALAVDEWRERAGQRELAEQARTALRAEMLANREAVIARLRHTAKLYVETTAHPDQAGNYVFARRNRPLLVNDAAWTMAVETGDIRWLSQVERTHIAELYAGQQRARDVVFEEMVRWTDLAGFPPTSVGIDPGHERAIRAWRAWAHRTQFALCVTAGRYERALGANIPERELVDYCSNRQPEEDPAIIYREWRKLGWVSSTAPKTIEQALAGE